MISIVLPIRNEFPQATWSVYSLVNDVERYDDFEVILVENACDEKNLKWLEWFGKGSMARKGFLRVLHSEPGVWPALRTGFDAAQGDILVWGCSHIAVSSGSIPAMADLLRKEGGICHSPMLWMGDYTAKRNDFKAKLYSYKHPINRGWSWTKPWTDRPFTVHSMGGGFSAAVREEHIEFEGLLEPHMKILGGGETYMDLKWWLLGSKVWVHPDSMYYHWAYKRDWRGDEVARKMISEGGGANSWSMWNGLITMYCLGGDEWAQKTYGGKLDRYPLWQDYYEKIKLLCKPSRDYIVEHQVYDGLGDLFERKPWDWPK